ncbi:MAG: Gfo/Idh/MocA family oxidoreductase [Bacteroidota bacterium]
MKDNTSKNFNRRDFVKSSALAMGGLMAMPVGAGAYAAGDDAIKVGLIGCGGRGTGAIVQALSSGQNVQLVAMADAFRDQLDKSYSNITKQEFRDWSGNTANVKDRVKVADDAKFVGFDAYQKVIDMVDVVVIATPPGFRPYHFEAAINAGKHVFMEKPLAVDATGIRKVLAAAEEAKKKKLNVVVGLQRHYQTVYREWVERIHGGMIGDVLTAHVYWNSAGVWVRDRAMLEKKAGRKITEMEYQMRNWYYFNWLCGDHITEQHIHNLDVGNWVMNAYPVRAHGMGGREVRKGKDHGQIFDHHFIEFEYENGARMFSQCRHIKNCMNRVSESFQGTNGVAPKPGLLKTRGGYKIWEHRGKNDPNPYQVEHDELFAAIAKGEYKYADAHNGAMSTMTSILGRMASYSGVVVEMKDALESDHNLMPAEFAFNAEPPVMPDAEGNYYVPVPGKHKPF